MARRVLIVGTGLIGASAGLALRAQGFDGVVALGGCDKNMPGCLIAMGRLNRPAIMVYGGTIKPGHLNHEKLDIVSAFQCYGEYIAGKIDRIESHLVRRLEDDGRPAD